MTTSESIGGPLKPRDNETRQRTDDDECGPVCTIGTRS